MTLMFNVLHVLFFITVKAIFYVIFKLEYSYNALGSVIEFRHQVSFFLANISISNYQVFLIFVPMVVLHSRTNDLKMKTVPS